MNNAYVGGEIATLSPLISPAVMVPSTEPVAGGIVDRNRMVEPGQTAQATSQQEPANPTGRARSWCQRLLAIAAHNPPALF